MPERMEFLIARDWEADGAVSRGSSRAPLVAVRVSMSRGHPSGCCKYIDGAVSG